MNRVLQLAASLTAVALLAGCASDQSGDVYSRDEARQVQTVRTGTITALRPVTIEGTKSPVGAGAGAVVGGIGGSAIGGGRGSFVTAIIGAVAGGLLGAATEEGFTKASGVEITVKEDDGGSRAYVQAVNKGEMFRVGERVRIMTVNGTSRVAPY
ncbi:hypothetical protein QP835_11840 [Pseudomonas oryzihabitans]|jgi:outer membrane lipoprotein SlyB|uniref:outer membrane lipoprotein n=1 Tax=Pseudomonas oryzihabitans TaxID=47885 RepID=UPI0025559374|nr:hypothetical protein [Pseudomonas oryzihabitans]MDK8264961.1 hypothetical protein [Pseudomonas oryzihabitans]